MILRGAWCARQGAAARHLSSSKRPGLGKRELEYRIPTLQSTYSLP